MTLCPIQTDREIVPFSLDEQLFKDWNYDKMPIITPSFPNSNSSFNISDATKEVILTEFEKGVQVTKAICEGLNVPWKRLFKKFPFFKAYQHFIQVSIVSKTEFQHDRWFGFAESKVKKIVQLLETYDLKILQGMLELRPYARTYDIKSEV